MNIHSLFFYESSRNAIRPVDHVASLNIIEMLCVCLILDFCIW